MNFLVICIVILVILIMISLFNNNNRSYKKNDQIDQQYIDNQYMDMQEAQDNQDKSDPKVLKYFGGAFCPHSRKGSRAYNLIKEFEEIYPNVNVQYFWTGDEMSSEEFTKANAIYVPTITNSCYNKIEMNVPEDTDTTDKSQDELKYMIMENMYNKL
jgi:hypothetical protein